MPPRLGGDGDALFQGVALPLCADDLQIQRSGIAVFVQHADVAHEVNVT